MLDQSKVSWPGQPPNSSWISFKELKVVEETTPANMPLWSLDLHIVEIQNLGCCNMVGSSNESSRKRPLVKMPRRLATKRRRGQADSAASVASVNDRLAQFEEMLLRGEDSTDEERLALEAMVKKMKGVSSCSSRSVRRASGRVLKMLYTLGVL